MPLTVPYVVQCCQLFLAAHGNYASLGQETEGGHGLCVAGTKRIATSGPYRDSENGSVRKTNDGEMTGRNGGDSHPKDGLSPSLPTNRIYEGIFLLCVKCVSVLSQPTSLFSVEFDNGWC